MSRELEAFAIVAKRIGKSQAESLLRALGRGRKLQVALDSEIGKQLLTGAISRITDLTEDLINGRYEPWSEDEIFLRAEIKVLRKIIGDWSQGLADFQESLDKYQKILYK